MIQGIYSATAGMINQQLNLEVITNNLANASTSGYKRDDLSFSGMINPLPTPYNSSALNLDVVSARFVTDFAQGAMRRTDNPLDLALDGDGFFVVQHAGGIRYTRSGNFSLNSAGLLVTSDGYPVLGNNGPIQIAGGGAAEQPEIDSAGQIIIGGTPVAKLKLVAFQDTSALVKDGSNTFKVKGNNVMQIPATAEVRQGYLETSNVSPVHEMVKMIESMRIYESYQRTAQLINETLEKANNELGKISV